MTVKYKVNTPISADDFIQLLRVSSLGARRPIDDHDCIHGMLNNSNLLVSAWQNDKLIGIARSMTDFHYACYLSDLAVDADYQRAGIGRRLLRLTQEQLGPRCKLLLVAAPDANSYYQHLGLENNSRCWILQPDSRI